MRKGADTQTHRHWYPLVTKEEFLVSGIIQPGNLSNEGYYLISCLKTIKTYLFFYSMYLLFKLISSGLWCLEKPLCHNIISWGDPAPRSFSMVPSLSRILKYLNNFSIFSVAYFLSIYLVRFNLVFNDSSLPSGQFQEGLQPSDLCNLE